MYFLTENQRLTSNNEVYIIRICTNIQINNPGTIVYMNNLSDVKKT